MNADEVGVGNRRVRCILWHLCGVLVALWCGNVQAESLDLGSTGDFSRGQEELQGFCHGAHGSATVFTEDSSWNKCLKLAVSETERVKKGEMGEAKNGGVFEVHQASVAIGCGRDGTAGFPVKPSTTYELTLGLRHYAPNARVSVRLTDSSGKTQNVFLSIVRPGDDWVTCRQRFATAADTVRAEILVSIWTSTEYNIEQAKVGDYILIDNIAVKELADVLTALKGRKFAVAPVPVVSEYAVPFLPRELLNPPKQIELRAAGNEIKPLPIAVANLTDRTAAYRVVVETVTEGGNVYKSGEKGLAGFPCDQVVFRKMVTYRSADAGEDFLRLDPVPKMDEACTLVVPPHEAGVAWFDFNTKDVKAGVYAGRVRIIPLYEKASWAAVPGTGNFGSIDYKGELQDIPLKLEVLPFDLPKEPKIPLSLCDSAANEQAFQLLYEVGVREFNVGPWSFQFPTDGKGGINASGTSSELKKVADLVRRHVAWAGKRDAKIRFVIGYSSWHAFKQIYGVSKDEKRAFALWPTWVSAVKRLMNDCGVADSDWALQTYDEPNPKLMEEILKVNALAHRAEPTVRTYLAMGYSSVSVKDMYRLAEETDCFELCHWGFFDGPEREEFLRKQIAAGKRISHYTCSTSMLASLPLEFRNNAWFGDRYGLTGNLLFWFTDNHPRAGDRDFKATTAGSVAYCSYGTFIPSVRYMAMREGMTDLKYMTVLAQVAAKDPEAQKLLKTAAKRVVQDESHDTTTPDRIRAEAMEIILRNLSVKR